jgi:hypothetical protein
MGQSHLTPGRQERQVFARRDARSRFFPCGFASWVSQALEYGAADWVNGFILPILSILLADQTG